MWCWPGSGIIIVDVGVEWNGDRTPVPGEIMATIEKALQIAAKAHEGQVDKEGLPYILHPLRVMAGVAGLEAQIVALLHDVIEDTPVTADDLLREGFGEAIVASVLCVTHRKDEPYADYVVRCK